MDTDDHFGGSIEPDLAVLRSFMYPAWDIIDVGKWVFSGLSEKGMPCWNRPPTCTLIYGPLSFDCVMEDLDIKITDFKEDLSPARAEVSVRLSEQTHSATPIIDFVTAHVRRRGVLRPGRRARRLRQLPAGASLLDLFSLRRTAMPVDAASRYRLHQTVEHVVDGRTTGSDRDPPAARPTGRTAVQAPC